LKRFTAVQRNGVVDVHGWAFGFAGTPPPPLQVRQGQSGYFRFSISESGCGSTTLEYLEIWIQDGNGHDLWSLGRWNNISFSYQQDRDFETSTVFIDPNQYKMGTYQAIMRGKSLVPRHFILINLAKR
jgi:hypothetical protein